MIQNRTFILEQSQFIAALIFLKQDSFCNENFKSLRI